MESLPALPVEKILRSLSVADLLSCSLVSAGWRSAVNDNHVWKKICYCECNTHTIDYLQTVVSKVPPLFQDPETSQERLEPLCHWRVVYMKLQHIKRNWSLGNHSVHEVTELAYNHFDLKIDNNILVANVEDNICDVWNILGIPYKEETIKCALKNTRCKCMIHLSNNKLVIVQDTLLQVYFKTDKRFKLCFRRLFNQSEIESKNIPGSLTIDDWYSEKVKLRPTHLQAYYIGKYFIGLAENESFERASFHIWDTITGSKLKEQSVIELCHGNTGTVFNIKFCLSKNDVDKILVCVQHSQETGDYEIRFYSVVYIYNLTTLAFTKLMVLKPHVPWIFYENNIIITISHSQTELSIYDSLNGSKIVSKEYDTIINPDSVQVHGDHLGFTTGKSLVVLRVKDFELVFTTSVTKFSCDLFGFDVVFLDWDLILISQWDETNIIEVWSIEKKCLLSTLKTNGLMFPCNNSAKFFVWNEMVTTIYMLQFW